MALEGASFLDDLVTTNPPGSDRVKQADDHLRLLKTVLKATFPGLTRAMYMEKVRENLASSATPNLGGTTSNFIHITGTTEIDGFTNGVAGMMKLVEFEDVLVLDHDAVNFPLIGSANITTEAGDRALFYAAGATEWHMLWFMRKSGAPVANALPDATETVEGVVEMATNAEIWASQAIGGSDENKAIMAKDLETAAAFQTIADAAPVALDWAAFENGVVTLTASRQIGNPTNEKPGQIRRLLCKGNDTTDRTITFASEYLGEVPTITDCDNNRWYMLYIECIEASHFSVSSKRVKG